ncbi:hypothetical protein B5807_01070 [Epicoccum nigrum]|uniref:BZIP domain-containing protein n=1 Tax=Epicoccum nigrum TaxID=105696 RepID=A0A1Y2MEI8_EPING|nr:hypothetical protein B5807_01070 [Epicoccum nigrum]
MNHSYHLSTKSSTSATVQSTAATSSETKPRRPNSELRKQQNRIASRNYREKRKRKLQQLEQLLDDDEDDDSNEGRAQTRSISPYQSRSGSGELQLSTTSPHIINQISVVYAKLIKPSTVSLVHTPIFRNSGDDSAQLSKAYYDRLCSIGDRPINLSFRLCRIHLVS